MAFAKESFSVRLTSAVEKGRPENNATSGLYHDPFDSNANRAGAVGHSNSWFTMPALTPFPPSSACDMIPSQCGGGPHRERVTAGRAEMAVQPAEW